MKKLLASLRAWLERVWSKPAPALPAVTMPRNKRTKAVSDRAFVHMTEVLNLLPQCRELIGPLRQVDADAYAFWRHFGAKIMPDSLTLGGELPPLDTFPGYGMVFVLTPGAAEDYLFPGVFMYFTKARARPVNAVMPPGTVAHFQVCCAFTDRKGHPFGYSYMVALSGNGDCSVISERQVRKVAKAGFWRIEWGVSRDLEFHYRDAKRRKATDDKSAQAFGATLFRIMTSGYVRTADDFQVRAERDGVSVAFNVALGRTPQFFKDRQTEVTTDGRRRRIFHAVKEHERKTWTGRLTTVKAHYRGERSFMWHGESIMITPSERSFAKTFNLMSEIYLPDQRVPKGEENLVDWKERFRDSVESEWRKERQQ